MANPEHVELVKLGPEAVRKWWKQQHYVGRSSVVILDLSQADLREANLAGISIIADLEGANLRGADLHGSDIVESNFERADLRGANLSGTDLCYSDLSDANLSRADLSNANLSGAALYGTIFDASNLSNTTMDHAECGYTVFSRVDLSTVIGLEWIRHYGPSSLDTHTLLHLHRKRHKFFLRGCGAPEAALKALPSIQRSENLWQDCFVMYIDSDNGFAQQLIHDLTEVGIRCWRYANLPNAAAEDLLQEARQATWTSYRVILLCSRESLTADWIVEDIESVLQREDGYSILVPVILDDYLFRSWAHPARDEIDSRLATDFHQSYKEGLDQLLNSLRITDLPHAHE